MIHLPPLFKRDKVGKVREWRIGWSAVSGEVQTSTGASGGVHTYHTYVAKAKRGTTNGGQAKKEAHARWTKQVQRHDYHEDVEQSGKQPRPMLATDYHKLSDKAMRNLWLSVALEHDAVWCQPKLDGLRLLFASRHSHTIPELMSRQGDSYKLGHIAEPAGHLLQCMRTFAHAHYSETVEGLDGEAYLHGLPLPTIVSRSRKYRQGSTEEIQYHIFDIVCQRPWRTRLAIMQGGLQLFSETREFKEIQVVPTYPVRDRDEMRKMHGRFTEQGYEGIILRKSGVQYAKGRSPGLIKFKQFKDEECLIVDVWEDRNSNAMLTVKRDNDVLVDVTPKRTHRERQYMAAHADEFIGKHIKVKYQEETKDGSLQFPVGLEIREVNENGPVE